MWTVAGSLFLAIGVAGVVLPLLPGTVFLFIASACFLRGSDRLHTWLHGHPVLGRQLRILNGEEPMPVPSKIVAISAMWIAVGVSIAATEILALQLALAILAIAGTWFIVAKR
jgi:uncharacterized protein